MRPLRLRAIERAADPVVRGRLARRARRPRSPCPAAMPTGAKGFRLAEQSRRIVGGAMGEGFGPPVAGGNCSAPRGLGQRICWRRSLDSVNTVIEMKPAIQKAADESAATPTIQSEVPASPGKPPFRLPTGFPRMKSHPARNARAEHRQAQRLRVDESARLAEKYPHLKTLKGSLEFVDREGMTKTTAIKYSANPEYAKSVLVFTCPIPECIGGDFDLTVELAEAATKQQAKVTGEVPCLGSHKKASGIVAPCRSVLRYTLNLTFTKIRAVA